MKQSLRIVTLTSLGLLGLFLVYTVFSGVLFNCVSILLGNRNWKVPLCYGYIIQEINGNEIFLIKESPESPTEVIISDYIQAYCYTDRYAAFICSNRSLTDTLSQYYVVDMEFDMLYGPLCFEGFLLFCKENQLTALNQWIRTSPMPEEAVLR